MYVCKCSLNNNPELLHLFSKIFKETHKPQLTKPFNLSNRHVTNTTIASKLPNVHSTITNNSTFLCT